MIYTVASSSFSSSLFSWTNHLFGQPVKMYSDVAETQLNGFNSLEQITVLLWVDYTYACLNHLFCKIKMAQIPNEKKKNPDEINK